MSKMKYDIEGLGRFIVHRGLAIRTPCSIELSNKKEMKFLEIYLDSNSIKYTKNEVQINEQKQNKRVVEKPKQEPVQEIKEQEIKKEPVTILEKLAVNENIEGINNEEN